MNTKLLFAAAAMLILTAAAFPQKVTITKDKKTYTRTNARDDHKKTFVIEYPVAKAPTPALSKKITSALNTVKILDINVNEELTEYEWLEEAAFEEVFNEKGLLTMMYWMEGSGAYPSGVTKYLVLDTGKGVRLTAADLFIDLDGLAKVVKQRQDLSIAEARKEAVKDPENSDEFMNELLSRVKFDKADLDHFAVEMTGVTFIYEFGFPHVIKALEPDGQFRLSWAELKPFVKPGSLLQRFIS